MEYTLCKFFGLQRSGNHAVISWLIGLDQENTFFFNMVRPGEDLLKRPSGVSLPKNTKAYATRVNGRSFLQPECLEWFKREGGRLLLSYENFPMGKFSQRHLDKPAVDRFGHPQRNVNFLVIRNPFNMLPSAEKMLRRTMVDAGKDEQWLAKTLEMRLLLWKGYAFLHLNPNSITRGNFVSFVFDRWVGDKYYRDEMAEKLGYINRDRFIDFVSDAGQGSSFTGGDIKQKEDVLSRWESSSSISKAIISKHPEVIDYTALIFGKETVPSEFYGLRQ